MKENFRYVSEKNGEFSQRIAELCETILNKDYGETISFYECAYILKYNIDDEQEKRKFRSTMSRVKNFLIDYGYILKSIAGVGYYILKPKQISGYCYHTYILRTERMLDKSDRILSHVDKSELSDNRKQEHKDMQELNANVIKSIDTTVENSEYFKYKDFYDSLTD